MSIVPIVFAFDSKLILPACICMSSLLANAKEDTFYDIFILYADKDEIDKEMLCRITDHYPHCSIQFITIENCFESAYEIRGITQPTYYRLLLPELIRQYDKIIYSDVDIIFRMDLSELYHQSIDSYYIAATCDFGLSLNEEGVSYLKKMNIQAKEYLQAGFIMMNLKKMREENCVDRFKMEAKKKYKFQDQDILNIVCQGKIKFLPPVYNMTNYAFDYCTHKRNTLLQHYTEGQLHEFILNGNIHYNGQKPWKGYCINFDIWWEYYRKSPFFDEKFYFDFFAKKMGELDRLSLWKRIKLLLRYFTCGRIKN